MQCVAMVVTVGVVRSCEVDGVLWRASDEGESLYCGV